ncbi:MAG: hypothetical protein A2W25_12045 [candidate division Zixibacteria bacterium RBG_16_53_22]|nr:MAG: hypothetical protein A2W25_12045 [candidate division Zixibacteria bacterium RBG_16_53_22]
MILFGYGKLYEEMSEEAYFSKDGSPIVLLEDGTAIYQAVDGHWCTTTGVTHVDWEREPSFGVDAKGAFIALVRG